MCDPNKKNSTHGGYIDGKILIPDYCGEDIYRRLSCVAADGPLRERILSEIQEKVLERHRSDVANISTLLLHNLRFAKAENSHKKVRRNDLEIPIMKERSCLLYKISNRRVYLDNSLITEMEGDCIDLGYHHTQMNIVALTPNKRCNSSGITISNVIEEKLKMIDMENWRSNYDTIIKFHDKSSGSGAQRKRKVGECFDADETQKEIQSFRICVETFRDEGCTDPYAKADISREIRNTANMICILACQPSKSELQGGVPVLAVSQGKSCKDVLPWFTVHDVEGNIQEKETEHLNQPDDKKIQRFGNTLQFETPAQNCCVIKQIRNKSLSIKVLLRKESDKPPYVSKRVLDFQYILNPEDQPKVKGACQDCTQQPVS